MHWLTAVLVFIAISLGWSAHEWQNWGGDSPTRYVLFMLHKSVGLSILALVLIRLLWRLSANRPSLQGRSWEQLLARITHGLLYLLLIGLPISGWLLNSAADIPLQWFGLFAVPDLMGASPALEEQTKAAHYYGAWLLIGLLLAHTAAAFKHHLVDRDATLAQMRPKTRGIFTVALLLGAFALVVTVAAQFTARQDGAQSIETVSARANESATETPVSQWLTLAGSTLSFSVDVMGERVKGEFKRFDPVIEFDPNSPESGSLNVSIATASADSNSSTRDEMLRDPDWFASATHPTARFVTQSIASSKDPNQFVGASELTLRGVTKPIRFPFRWQQLDAEQARLTANVVINRMDFGVGAEAYPDQDTAGHEVTISVNLLLKTNPDWAHQ